MQFEEAWNVYGGVAVCAARQYATRFSREEQRQLARIGLWMAVRSAPFHQLSSQSQRYAYINTCVRQETIRELRAFGYIPQRKGIPKAHGDALSLDEVVTEEGETREELLPAPDDVQGAAELGWALSQLPPVTRSIILMSELGGYKHHEIGVALGLGAHAAQLRKSRGMAKLRALMAS